MVRVAYFIVVFGLIAGVESIFNVHKSKKFQNMNTKVLIAFLYALWNDISLRRREIIDNESWRQASASLLSVKSPSAAACSGACGDISTSCCLELKAATKRADASLLGALVIMMMMLMKKMLSAAVVGFLHAAVDFQNLGQPVRSKSRVSKNK